MGRICDAEGMRNKEALETMVHSAGYKTIGQFCREVGINQTNLYSNLNGTWKMSLKRMFKVANTLRVPIDKIIAVFYPDEYWENVEKVEQSNQEEMDKLFSSEM